MLATKLEALDWQYTSYIGVYPKLNSHLTSLILRNFYGGVRHVKGFMNPLQSHLLSLDIIHWKTYSPHAFLDNDTLPILRRLTRLGLLKTSFEFLAYQDVDASAVFTAWIQELTSLKVLDLRGSRVIGKDSYFVNLAKQLPDVNVVFGSYEDQP